MTCVFCGMPLLAEGGLCTACGRPQPPPPALTGEEPTHVRAQSGEEAAIPARSGDVLDGKWQLERKLGEGGMGTVFLAHDLQLDRKVAVKLLHVALANDPELVMRFEREARMTAGLEHPNIVPVYAVGRFHGRPFMVMKALDGGTLHTLIRAKGALKPRELLHVARQLASGLDFIHAKGFIHRDIKAANIFIGPDGHATILDFGILRPSRGAQALTRTGLVMGTPHYMSPEQAKGFRELDHRSDLYALAVLLFESASGTLPFESDNDLSIIQMQAYHPPPGLCERAPWVPRAVGDIIARALSKEPNERYPSAGDFIRALEAAYVGQAPLPLVAEVGPPVRSTPSGANVPAHPTTPAVPSAIASIASAPGPDTAALAKTLKRPRWPLLAGVVGGMLLVAGVGYLSSRQASEPAVVEQPTPVEASAARSPVPAPGEPAPTAPAREPPPEEVAAIGPDAGEAADEPATGEPVEGPAAEPTTPDAGEPEPEGQAGARPERPVQTTGRGGSRSDPALAKLAARGMGQLRIVSTHKKERYWAKVSVDGTPRGTTPVLLELPAGTHQVRVERVGFRTVERQIKIAPGRSAVLRIELVP